MLASVIERKRGEKALRDSQEHLRQALQASNTGLWDWNTDTKEVSFSREWKRQLGYEESDLTDAFESWKTHLHSDDHDRAIAFVQAYLANPLGEYQQEFRLRCKDGTYRWIETRASFVTETDGRRVRLLGSHTDITERKRVEHESRERIRQASAMQAALLELAQLDDTSLTFSIILPQVTSIVADMLAVERVSLWLLSEDQTELVCQDLYLRGQATHSAGSRLATSSYPHYLAVLKESLVIGASNARVDQRTNEFADDYFPALGITSVLDVPIHRQGKVVGVLWCEHVGMPREWAPEAQDFGASVGQTIVRMIEASERRRAEISLRQSEERYRSLVDNAPIGIFVNEEGRFVYVNREMQRILKSPSAEQLIGTPVLNRIAPEFHQMVKARIHTMMDAGQPVPTLDEQYIGLDGLRVDVSVTAIPTSLDGIPVMQVLVLDITARKQAEEALRKKDLELDHYFTSALDLLYIADATGHFKRLNKAWELTLGYSLSELEEAKFLDYVHPDDLEATLHALGDLTEQKQVLNFVNRYRRKDGSYRWIEWKSIPAGEFIYAAARDITERKRMEDALRMRERELYAALQERERISQDLHDGILQSLFAVGLNLEVAKSLMPPKTRKTSGASLDKAIDQLNGVMREVRTFIAGVGSDLFEGKDLQAALQSMLTSLTENQPTRVRLAVEKRAAQAVSAEQSFHLFRVIQEAVSNCIRHGGAQEARVSLKILKQGVRLSIRDNGRGFDQDTVKEGGYGLHNMAARAKKIGGRFTVLSKENEGMRIVLDLPKEAPNISR